MKKVIIHGATWTDNFGDTLFFEVFGDKIRNLGYEPVLVNADNNLVKQLSFEINNYKNLKKALRESSAIVYVGGAISEKHQIFHKLEEFYGHSSYI